MKKSRIIIMLIGMAILICTTCYAKSKLVEPETVRLGIQDKDGNTALIYAIKGGNEEIIELLLKRPDIKIDMEDIAIKAKTNEKMDAVGEMRAIEANAIVSMIKI